MFINWRAFFFLVSTNSCVSLYPRFSHLSFLRCQLHLEWQGNRCHVARVTQGHAANGDSQRRRRWRRFNGGLDGDFALRVDAWSVPPFVCLSVSVCCWFPQTVKRAKKKLVTAAKNISVLSAFSAFSPRVLDPFPNPRGSCCASALLLTRSSEIQRWADGF